MQRSLCLNGSCLDNCWTKSDNKIGVAMNGVIYHEKQVKEMCALHTLNNLFQEREAFNKYELDNICHSLSPNVWINPHKSLLGLGNYDVNVIMAALHRRGYEAIWFDKRKDPKCLNLANIFGFILNVPSDYKLGFVMLPLRRRHWVAIRDICGTYYNLDSKFQSPQLIGRVILYCAHFIAGIFSRDPKCLNLANIFGFILNVPSDYKLGFVMLPLRRRHWVAIRDICGTYYNLDSKFQSPQLIGRMDDVVAYLYGQLQSKEKELFVVVHSDVERSQGWQLDDICSNHVIALDNRSPKDLHPAASVPGDDCPVSRHSPRINGDRTLAASATLDR
uniref:ubiquitinyl hydrolase 1 n=1 Tax=Timema cristinae TaxID=61476 RepID=A0A7R9D884_TIMCR|nr:unnamed protein product [Timema cristinae]